MRPSNFLRLIFVVTVLTLAATVVGQPGPPTSGPPVGAPAPAHLLVSVDCDAGDTLTDALASRAVALTIEFRGVCAEHVEIRRDQTVLRGVAPSAAISGPSSTPSQPALSIHSARGVSLDDFVVTDADSTGLWIDGGSVVDVGGLRVHDAARHGALVDASIVHIAASTFEDNGADGLGIWNQSTAVLAGEVRAEGNGRVGLIVSASSLNPESAGVGSLEVSGNLVGLVSQSQASVGFGRLDPFPVVADHNVYGVWSAGGELSVQVLAADANDVGILVSDGGYFAASSFLGQVELPANNLAGLWAFDNPTVLLDGAVSSDDSGVYGLRFEGGEARLTQTSALDSGAYDLSLAFGAKVDFGGSSSFGTIECDGTALTRGPISCPANASAALRAGFNASARSDLRRLAPFPMRP